MFSDLSFGLKRKYKASVNPLDSRRECARLNVRKASAYFWVFIYDPGLFTSLTGSTCQVVLGIHYTTDHAILIRAVRLDSTAALILLLSPFMLLYPAYIVVIQWIVSSPNAADFTRSRWLSRDRSMVNLVNLLVACGEASLARPNRHCLRGGN